MQFLEPLRRDRRRRLHQQILRLLVHREGDDLADVRRVGQQHDDAVDARRRAAMRRRAVFEGVEHAAEPRLDLFRRIAGDRKGLVHDVGAMIADRARRQLDAVADDVVLERVDRQRILRLERLEPALRHRERVVAEVDLPGLLVALVHREIGDPAELEDVRCASGRARCRS